MSGLPALPEPLFAVAFAAGALSVTWIEAVAFAAAVASVVCSIRVDARVWPLAIVASLLYLLVFWHERLYGSAALQLLFAAVAVWGWRQWLHGTAADGAPLGVGWLCARGRWAVVAAIALAWPATALRAARLDRHRGAVVGRLPDRGERRQPVARRPQARRELGGVDRRRRRRRDCSTPRAGCG